MNGEAYGNAELIRLAADDGRLPIEARADRPTPAAARVSLLLGVLGLAALLLRNGRR